MSHWRYLTYVLRHKWFVFLAGLTLKVPLLQLITHDWSKFLPSEWIPYVRYFYGPKAKRVDGQYFHKPGDDRAFDYAWLLHQHRQPHHWQHWLCINLDVGMQYNANDEEGMCQCLSLRNTNGKSVQTVGSKAPEMPLSMGDRCEDGAHDANWRTIASTTKSMQNVYESGTGSETPKTQRPIVNDRKIFWRGIAVRCWSTTEALLQNVRAVVNQFTNFLPWITSTGAERNIGPYLAQGDSEPTGGRSKTTSRRSSAYFATTATARTVSTGIVPIRETQILRRDDGSISCLNCGGTLPNDCIEALPMKGRYVREMVADWIGAGRAQAKGAWNPREVADWYKRNKERMVLHPITQRMVEYTILTYLTTLNK